MYKLIYNKPAKKTHLSWEREAFHIGNSYNGITIYGDFYNEIIHLNEKTLWKGGPSVFRKNYNGGNIKNSQKNIEQMQEALEKNDNKKIDELSKKIIGEKEGYGAYQSFGEIKINFKNVKKIRNYKRELDLENSIVNIKANIDGIRRKANHFASYIDRAVISKYESEKNNIDLDISFISHQKLKEIEYDNFSIKAFGEIEDNKMLFYLHIKIVTDGEIEYLDKINIKKASYVNIFSSFATNYKNVYPNYRGENPKELVDSIISKIEKLGYEELLERHKKDYKNIFDRNKIEISNYKKEIETNKLLKRYKNNLATVEEKNYLEELLYAYGKYLLISSSRKGTLPSNLQGIWNDSNSPIWGSDYHLNINLEMNYFPVYKTNMVDCSYPLIDYVNSLVKPGRETVKAYYKYNSNDKQIGWVTHNQNTIFGYTCPGWEFNWGYAPSCSSFILNNCFEHFLFTEDKEFLRDNIYDALKENSIFWMNNLIYSEKLKRYISSPTYSPEHGPITNGNAYENILIYNLFLSTKKAAIILNEDKNFIDKLDFYLDNLNPIEIGKFNQIKEWYEEDEWIKNKFFKNIIFKKKKIQKDHRHLSHLFFLYPLLQLYSGKYFDSAKNSINFKKRFFIKRNIPGWAKVNRAIIYTILKESTFAIKYMEKFIKNNIANNLVDLHPPFQIDGNLGYVALINEMLVFTNQDYIELLPILNKRYKKGKVKGVLAQGSYEINFSFDEYRVNNILIKHKEKTNIKIKVNQRTKDILKTDEEFIEIMTNKEINL